ncbi:MAG: AsmA family protein, partial [Inhella sp.]|nr:AsmA family protein [Inhella sp.]
MPLIPSRSVRLPMHRRHVLWSLSRHAVRLVVGLLLALWSLLLIGWLTLHWGILPHIDEWRPQIEQRASAALGLPVRIGRIEVRSSGWVPALELHEVVLSGRDGREALRLPRVSAALSPQSLLAWQLRFAQLYIEGPELEIRRDVQGRLHVGGLDMDSSAAMDDSAARDWLFDQHEFTIR